MRPFEALLWLANLVGFLFLVAPGQRESRWPRRVALLVLMGAGLQALIEGSRWQMFPAYGLSIAFFLVALLRGNGEEEPSELRRLVARIGLWVGGAAVLASGVIPIAVPVFRFPRPDGPYAVGTVSYHWVDASRPEIFTSKPDDKRELMVQVWYPARKVSFAPQAAYIPDGETLRPLAHLMGMRGFLFRHLPDVTTNSVPYAAIASDHPNYPVLIFAHSLGGYRQQNTRQIEELVSHGYVVAAMDQPYVAAGVDFPDEHYATFDGRMLGPKFQDTVIPYLARDVSFTLDQLAAMNRADPNKILTGHLNMARAGAFGVSLGGAVIAEACAKDARLQACLPIDAFMPADVVRSGLRQPVMWITPDPETMGREGWDKAKIDRAQSTMRTVFHTLPGDGYTVVTPGAYEANFTDAPLFAVHPVAALIGLTGPVSAGQEHKLVDAFSLAFFDRHLQGAPAPLLDDPAKTYPKVLYQSRRVSAGLKP